MTFRHSLPARNAVPTALPGAIHFAAHLAVLLLWLALEDTAQAQFNFVTNNGTITITGYSGSDSEILIPDSINNLPVRTIGVSAFSGRLNITAITLPDGIRSIDHYAFDGCRDLAAISIPDTVTNIGLLAFRGCANLASAYVGNNVPTLPKSAFENCPKLSQLTIGNNVTYIGDYAFARCGMTNVTIPYGVKSISWSAFDGCTNLVEVTIPNSVTNLGGGAGLSFGRCPNLKKVVVGSAVTSLGNATFLNCTNLTEVYFQGNAPAGSDVFAGATNATIYYLPGTTGWSNTFAGQTTALWRPRLKTDDAQFGVHANQFGFNIEWAGGMTVVIEACDDLANPAWIPLQTNLISDGLSPFTDPDWASHPSRIYRARW